MGFFATIGLWPENSVLIPWRQGAVESSRQRTQHPSNRPPDNCP